MYKLYFFICICFVSCSISYSPEIEEVLQQAGDNRKELEQVLQHYSQKSRDSLKLRAAEFLIVNMPGKYSEYYDAAWNDVATVRMRWTSSPDKQRVLETYKLSNPVIEADLTHITAEYLINNIDLAFKVWRERPWGKHIPFDVFCEEILPYRLNTEPLENWREKALASFSALDATLNKPDITSVDACQIINAMLPEFRLDNDFPYMNYSQLMASARGSCEAMTSLTTFTMRALGVPVTVDFTPKWVKLPTGHTWSAVRDSTGRHISFMGTETVPSAPHNGTNLLKSKVYRRTFANQQNFLTDRQNIPPLLLQDFNYIKDVSAEYSDCRDTVNVPLKYSAPVFAEHVYLAFKQDGKFYPIAWTENIGQEACFPSVGRNIVYQPMYYIDGAIIPASDPFLLNAEGKLTADNSDETSDTNIILAVNTEENLQVKGLWLFNDPTNLGKAEIGKPLLLNGRGISSVEAGAVRVDKGSYFRCNHGLAATKNKNRVNEYTLMIDFKIDSAGLYTLLQTNLSNDDDIDIFINPKCQIGITNYYAAGIILLNRWNRYAITVRCGSAGTGGVLRQYLNGVFVNEILLEVDERLKADGHLSLDPAGCLFFADPADENNGILINAIAIWGRALSAEEVTAGLGKADEYDFAP